MYKLLTILFPFMAFIGIKDTLPNNGHKGVNRGIIDYTTSKGADSVCYTTLVPGINDYALQIKTTYLNDTNYLKNDWPTVQNQVVVAQELIFKYKNSVLRARPFDVRKRSDMKLDKEVTLLDAVVFEAAIITGTKGSFYKIRGSGGCTDCSNYTGYYSLSGELLFENYFSDGDGFIRNIGSYEKVWKRYGVAAGRAKIPDIKDITVFPPKYSGSIDVGYIL
jgi:hypothetical protein